MLTICEPAPTSAAGAKGGIRGPISCNPEDEESMLGRATIVSPGVFIQQARSEGKRSLSLDGIAGRQTGKAKTHAWCRIQSFDDGRNENRFYATSITPIRDQDPNQAPS